jgi:hypothetical protein
MLDERVGQHAGHTGDRPRGERGHVEPGATRGGDRSPRCESPTRSATVR